MKLYEISRELMKLEEAIEIGSKEEVLEICAKEYFAMEGEFEDKIEKTGYLMINQKSEEIALKNEIHRLQQRLDTMKNKRGWLKAYLKNHMEANNVLKLPFTNFNVSVVKNPPSVEIWDEKKVPSRFVEIVETHKIKKNEIKEVLKSGKEVDGATLVTNKTNLRIK